MTVCILGNNLTALTLAKALVNQSITVNVLFDKKKLNLNQNRTIGISKSNIDFFNENIININQLLWKLNKIEIFSDNLKDEKLINFQKKNKQIFSIVKNNKLYQLLAQDLFKNKYYKSKNFNSRNLALLDKYDLIINCDSSNIIAKKFFSKKIKKKYNSNAHTTILEHEKIPNDSAIQIFTKKGPLAFLPISNTKTSVVYSVDDYVNKKKEDIKKIIRENFNYNIKKIEKISTFKLQSVDLRSYYHNNILAFGDLLHKIHPLAGQGFNMTIRDIKILLDIITKRYNLGLPLDGTVSIEFQKNVKHKNFIFSQGIDLVNEFFNFERKTNNTFLSKSVQFINKYPKINSLFSKIADRGIIF